jgi:hypothetical protein
MFMDSPSASRPLSQEEVRFGRALERLAFVGLQPEGAPDPDAVTPRVPERPGHAADAPVDGDLGAAPQGPGDDLLNRRVGELARGRGRGSSASPSGGVRAMFRRSRSRPATSSLSSPSAQARTTPDRVATRRALMGLEARASNFCRSSPVRIVAISASPLLPIMLPPSRRIR